MAEYVLSVLLGSAASLIFGEIGKIFDTLPSLGKLNDKVMRLVGYLQIMLWYLEHADAKQERVAQVGSLIAQIRMFVYDAEDFIDAYVCKALLSTYQESSSSSSSSSWGLSISLSEEEFSLYRTQRTSQAVKYIDVLNSRATQILEVLAVNKTTNHHLNLMSENGQQALTVSQTSSVVYSYENEGEYIVGLDTHINQLMQVLKEEKVNVVSIVGMGGSGKTTLARQLYNHPSTIDYFNCRAWVHISKEWTPHRLLSEILRQVAPQEMKPSTSTSNNANNNNMMMSSSLGAVADQLRSTLASKSYLLVLDDAWSEEAIKEILKSLPSCLKMSKIIITSRCREIFSSTQYEVYVHESHLLNPDQGWDLFTELIHWDHRPCYKLDRSSYESLGKEMLDRCGGLPLAIVALAGILREKETITKWQMVGKTVDSNLMEANAPLESIQPLKIRDLLALSYEDLPYHLKACFLYMGAFQEYDPIPAGTLTRLWIAEGLVPDTGTSSTWSLEDKAIECLYELSNRFMIQVARTNFKREIKAVCLHPLLRHLCLETSKQQSFLEIDYTDSSNPPTRFTSVMALAAQPRRVALHSRSIIVQAPYNTISWVAQLNKFSLLRVLRLWRIKTHNGKLTRQIGKLCLLRYLCIRFTNIAELPKAIGNLGRLLTLDYRNVVDMKPNAFIVIPYNLMSKLKLLRHLYLPINCPWRAKELKLAHLSHLQNLWGVKLQEYQQNGRNNNIDWLAKEMPMLSKSVKKLWIAVSTKKSLKAAFSCPSLKSDALHTFHCEMIRAERSGTVTLALRDVEPLSQLQHMHKLILVGKIEMDLSLLLPTKLLVLELKDSLLREVNPNPMAFLGKLTHLRILRLDNFYLGSALSCGSGSFPQLEELYLARLENLETWNVEDGSMSCLRKLEIIMCGNLKEFPQGLLSIVTLEQLECFEVSEEFRQGATAHRKLRQTFQLPHNCEAIIQHRDNSVDVSSLHKLCEELTSGIFLSNKNKKYWIVKQRGRYNNCFMVYVKNLHLSCADGTNYWTQNELIDRPIPPMRTVYAPDQLDTRPKDEGRYCQWSEVAEKDGAVVTVAKVKSHALKFEAKGRIDSRNLSPEVTYQVAYVIMLEGQGHGWMMHVDCSLTLPDGSVQKNAETLNDKPRDAWVRVSVGEFKITPQNIGEIEFSFYCERLDFWKVGLIIKGVIIEPKM